MIQVRLLTLVGFYGLLVIGPIGLVCLTAILISRFIKNPNIRRFVVNSAILLFWLSLAAVVLFGIGFIILAQFFGGVA